MQVSKTVRAAAASMLGLVMALSPVTAPAKAPTVLVSIPPLHSLVAAVMGGTGKPVLMLRGGRSPHDAALRPSDLRRLRDASLVVWVGPVLETFLAKPLAAIGKGRDAVVTLLDLPNIRRLPRRTGRSWAEHHHDHDHEAPPGTPAAMIDPHIWLSPANAAVIAESVSAALIAQDSANAAAYRENARKLVARIGALDKRLAGTLAPVRDRPYLVFHDAYQYFERHYALQALGAVSIDPERRPGARRVAEIRRQIERSGVRCVFREPQFPPRLLETMVEGTQARIGILDPLGADIAPGPDLWFAVMTGLGRSLARCLSEGA